MTTMTWADWKRYEAALLAVSGLNGEHAQNLRDVRQLLDNGPNWDGAVKYWGLTKAHTARFWAVAVALEMDKRRRLDWVDANGEDATAHVNASHYAAVDRPFPNGMFRAYAANSKRDGVVMVHGFPDRKSAIDVLERILGRAEFDSLFAEVA